MNFDNNQHGENENLRLGHLFAGIQINRGGVDDVGMLMFRAMNLA